MNTYYQAFVVGDDGTFHWEGVPREGDPAKWLQFNRDVDGTRDDDGRGWWVIVVLEM